MSGLVLNFTNGRLLPNGVVGDGDADDGCCALEMDFVGRISLLLIEYDGVAEPMFVIGGVLLV